MRSPAPRTYWVEAIVLRAIPYSEKDRIVTLFTRQRGKITAIAKGARNPLTRLAPATQSFAHGYYYLAKGKTFEVITQVRLQETYPNLRCNVTLMVTCGEICEMVMKSVAEGDADVELFNDLLATLRIANRGVDPNLLFVAFASRLLHHLGHFPELSQCVICAKRLMRSTMQFSTVAGGVLCDECANRRATDGQVHRTTAKVLRLMAFNQPYDACQLQVPENVLQEARKLLMRFWQFHFQAELQATRVHEQLKGEL